MRVVGGEWRGRRLAAPSGRATRPTTDRVREAWMSALRPDLGGARVIDLFAGTGALGIEALSEGATSCTFVERGSPALRVLQSNLEALDVDPGRYSVMRADVHRAVERLDRLAYDIALADPPYAGDDAERLVRSFHTLPFARILCVEHDPRTSFPWSPIWDRRYGDTALTFFAAPDA